MLQLVYAKTNPKSESGGFIALITVLIVGAVGIAIGTTLLLLGLNSSQGALALQRSKIAKSFADACAEQALWNIHQSVAYSGTGELTFSGGSCTFTVENTGGQNRRITISGTTESTVRKVKITPDQITPTINLTSWQEVADY